MITLFVSGAVHLTLIGGGWLDSADLVRLGGQPLNVTVTASRGDDSADTEDAVDTQQQPDRQVEKQTEGWTTPLAEEKAFGAIHDSAVPAASLAQAETDLQRQSALRPPPDLKPLLTQADDIKTETSTGAATSAVDKPESTAQQSAPFYQSNPEFMIPPEYPVYPRLARKRGIEGQVIIRVEIGRDGGIEALQLEQSSGSDLLDQAARSAVQRWQFMPAKVNGQTVASYVRVPIDFVLENH